MHAPAPAARPSTASLSTNRPVPSPHTLLLSLAWIRDPVEHAVDVIPDQQGAVPADGQARRPAEVRLAALDQEAGQKLPELDRLTVLVELDAHHLVAAGRRAVPGAVHGHEDVVAVLLGELRACVEHHLDGGAVGLEIGRAHV